MRFHHPSIPIQNQAVGRPRVATTNTGSAAKGQGCLQKLHQMVTWNHLRLQASFQFGRNSGDPKDWKPWLSAKVFPLWQRQNLFKYATIHISRTYLWSPHRPSLHIIELHDQSMLYLFVSFFEFHCCHEKGHHPIPFGIFRMLWNCVCVCVKTAELALLFKFHELQAFLETYLFYEVAKTVS